MVKEAYERSILLLQERIDLLEAENQSLLRKLEAAEGYVETHAAVQHDAVDHPQHYTTGGIETIDYIRAKLTPEEFVGYCKGNILKYVSRATHKGGLEDLRKAGKYIEFAICDERLS